MTVIKLTAWSWWPGSGSGAGQEVQEQVVRRWCRCTCAVCMHVVGMGGYLCMCGCVQVCKTGRAYVGVCISLSQRKLPKEWQFHRVQQNTCACGWL